MFRLSRPLPSRRPYAPAPRRKPVLACPVCGSDRICPIDWAPAGDDHWWLLMHCGECLAWVQATVGNEQAAVLDVELDRQQAEIRDALASLEAERMAADVEAFTTALELDLVDADDFALSARRPR
jgi:hypothetical protein